MEHKTNFLLPYNLKDTSSYSNVHFAKKTSAAGWTRTAAFRLLDFNDKWSTVCATQRLKILVLIFVLSFTRPIMRDKNVQTTENTILDQQLHINLERSLIQLYKLYTFLLARNHTETKLQKLACFLHFVFWKSYFKILLLCHTRLMVMKQWYSGG